MKKDKEFYAFIYQYIVLISIIVLNAGAFIVTKEFNETLVGALIGVMTTIPMKRNDEVK